jgi:quercetin dioxygenase-like cupin family protein
VPDRFEDERGVIEDLFGELDAVTRITTRKGAVRGNHIHHKTVQWALILTGELLVVTGQGDLRREKVYGPGEISCERPGVPHAWKALADTEVLVFTRGPRSGEGYESDTERLSEPLL